MSISGDYVPLPGGHARELRVAAGYSLREFAREQGYDFGYLSKVETGSRPMTPELARLYADLGSDPDARPRSHPPRSRLTRTAADTTAAQADRLDLGFTSFGAEIRRLRLDKDLSLREVGDAVHVSRAQLARIELGQSRGDYRLALHLGIVLGHRGLTQLFLDEQAAVVPVVPGPEVLTEAARPLAVTAARERFVELRKRSHAHGPHVVLPALARSASALYQQAVNHSGAEGFELWAMACHYVEFVSWMAQEARQPGLAERWAALALEWGTGIGDACICCVALTQLSHLARRRGDVGSAVALARAALALSDAAPRLRRFAAQREAQALALGGDRNGFARALDRARTISCGHEAAFSRVGVEWGPRPDAAFEESRLFEAACLVDLGAHREAAELFGSEAGRLTADRAGHTRTGYARIAVREALAYARTGDSERACAVLRRSLPTVARTGSASLRGDLYALVRVLDRRRVEPHVRAILPELVTLAAVAGHRSVPPKTSTYTPTPRTLRTPRTSREVTDV